MLLTEELAVCDFGQCNNNEKGVFCLKIVQLCFCMLFNSAHSMAVQLLAVADESKTVLFNVALACGSMFFVCSNAVQMHTMAAAAGVLCFESCSTLRVNPIDV